MSDRKYIVPKWLDWLTFGVALGWFGGTALWIHALVSIDPATVDPERLDSVALILAAVSMLGPLVGFWCWARLVKWNTDRKGKHRASVNSSPMVIDDLWAGP